MAALVVVTAVVALTAVVVVTAVVFAAYTICLVLVSRFRGGWGDRSEIGQWGGWHRRGADRRPPIMGQRSLADRSIGGWQDVRTRVMIGA
jgi:hypothetical protein